MKNSGYFVQNEKPHQPDLESFDPSSSFSVNRTAAPPVPPGLEHSFPKHIGQNRSKGSEPTAHQDLEKEVILLISTSSATRSALRHLLKQSSFHIQESSWGRRAIPWINEDLSSVLIDVSRQDAQTGLLCQYIKSKTPDLPIIVVDEPDRPMDYRRSVYPYCQEYLTKPCDRVQLLTILEQNVRFKKLTRENHDLRQLRGFPLIPLPMIGHSPISQTLNKQIEAFGCLDNTVLISGEHGVGKNVVAQQIHQASKRANQPFLVISCSSVTSNMLEADLFGYVTVDANGREHQRIGRLELLSGGTIYLDKVEQLSPHLQAKLLQFLQEKTFRSLGAMNTRVADTRILASAGCPLAVACAQGTFREDLFYQLSSMTLSVPTLRERLEDLPELSRILLEQLARQFGANLPIVSPDAVHKMKQYFWPGNLTELESVLFRAMCSLKDTMISETDIMFDPSAYDRSTRDGTAGLAGLTMAEIERRAIIETMHSCGGNRALSAQKLGISEKTIYNKIKHFNLRHII